MTTSSSADPLVLDTSFVVALTDAADVWHSRAVAVQQALPVHRGVFVDVVVNETTAVLGRRLEQKGRSREHRAVLESLLQRIPVAGIVWLTQFGYLTRIDSPAAAQRWLAAPEP